MRRGLPQEIVVDPAAALPPEPFRKALSAWYRQHARDLPWRGVRHPYGTWLSEIMLQQTRVATVIDRYSEFLRRFPTLADLAAAPEDAVLALWSGLGYYRRARMLHRGAQFVVRELRGRLPETAAELRTLPGVGEYTAAAIASIAFGQSVAVLDGNVERVLLRLLGRPAEPTAANHTFLLRAAGDLVPPAAARRGKSNPPGDHNQAMMELGATLCLPRGPLCLHCPVYDFCRTRGEHPATPRAPLRSRHVAYLLTTRKRGVRTEVLLERRAAESTLMPGMLELPPLPLEAVAGREPALRLRHSITNTNYYVEVYAEGAAGAPPATTSGSLPEESGSLPWESSATEERALIPPVPDEVLAKDRATERGSGDPLGTDGLETEDPDAPFAGEPGLLGSGRSLRHQIPAARTDLVWCSTQRLYDQPLTGLARKTLQRVGLMPMRSVRVRNKGAV